MRDIGALFEHIGAADHLVHGAEAHARHAFAQGLGKHDEIVDDGLRCSGELGAKFRILSRNAYGAGVQMALSQHDATHRD